MVTASSFAPEDALHMPQMVCIPLPRTVAISDKVKMISPPRTGVTDVSRTEKFCMAPELAATATATPVM